MANWWVNHKQTYRQETDGGYLWSPKRNQNGARNQTYENMAQVEPGDLIFSYANGQISQVGIATDRGMSSSKPSEFGSKGGNWNADGWMVPVRWIGLRSPIRPKDHLSDIVPLLPASHSPIGPDGNGRQNAYLAGISDTLSAALLSKTGQDQSILTAAASIEVDNPIVDATAEAIERQILNDTTIASTERHEIVKARRGQGRFRRNVEQFEVGCRITGVTDRRLLRASHIKPWRLCESNHERLDGNNGLLLTPTFDLLFDQGYLSFRDDGSWVISPKIAADQVASLGVAAGRTSSYRTFNEAQRQYLRFHRELFAD